MRGLPQKKTIQEPDIAKLLEILVLNDGLESTDVPPGLWPAVNHCFAEGWVNSEEIGAGGAVVYYLVSEIHRWYCQLLLTRSSPDYSLPHSDPISLALDIVRQFRPRFLADPPRNSWARHSPPPEDAYQKEFYRSLYALVGGRVTVSPEFVTKKGPGGGTIDFLLSEKKWGFELIRDRDRFPEHVARFTNFGPYGCLIRDGVMTDYVLLDFTTIQPMKPHPGRNPRKSTSGTC